MKSSEKIHIATIGKCVGLFGDLKLHLHTDFTQQFKRGNSFVSDSGEELTIFSYDENRSLVRFNGYSQREKAAFLTNKKLFSSVEKSIKECQLKEGEYFWFEMVGATVEENGRRLGVVTQIQRIANIDYLVVKSDKAFIERNLAKTFFIPYISRYIDKFDKDNKIVHTKDAYDILEAS